MPAETGKTGMRIRHIIGSVATALVVLAAATPVAAAPNAEHGQPVPMAFARSGDVWLSTGTQTVKVTVDGDNTWPRISPNHRELAYVHDGDIFVADISHIQSVFPSDQLTYQHDAGGPSWSPDGSYLAYRTGDAHRGTLVLLRLHSARCGPRSDPGCQRAPSARRRPWPDSSGQMCQPPSRRHGLRCVTPPLSPGRRMVSRSRFPTVTASPPMWIV